MQRPKGLTNRTIVASAPVRDEVTALIRTAESLNVELLDVIDRLTNETIEKLRKKIQQPDLII